jgi:hypothetical protein
MRTNMYGAQNILDCLQASIIWFAMVNLCTMPPDSRRKKESKSWQASSWKQSESGSMIDRAALLQDVHCPLPKYYKLLTNKQMYCLQRGIRDRKTRGRLQPLRIRFLLSLSMLLAAVHTKKRAVSYKIAIILLVLPEENKVRTSTS